MLGKALKTQSPFSDFISEKCLFHILLHYLKNEHKLDFNVLLPISQIIIIPTYFTTLDKTWMLNYLIYETHLQTLFKHIITTKQSLQHSQIIPGNVKMIFKHYRLPSKEDLLPMHIKEINTHLILSSYCLSFLTRNPNLQANVSPIYIFSEFARE